MIAGVACGIKNALENTAKAHSNYCHRRDSHCTEYVHCVLFECLFNGVRYV